MENLPSEEWRAVVGWEGYYEVSSLGRVRSVTRMVSTRKSYLKPLTGRVLKQGQSTTGYPSVMLCVDGNHKFRKVHRLVGMAFVPNPNQYAELNHIDGNPQNGAASNLEWCSRQHNIAHAWETGLSKVHYNRKRGAEQYLSKLTEDQVRQIRLERAAGAEIIPLGRKYGVNHSTISSICLRKTWKHIE